MERKRKKTFDHSCSFIPIQFALELVLATHFSYSATFTQGLNILLNILCIFILYMLYLVGYLFAYMSLSITYLTFDKLSRSAFFLSQFQYKLR